MSAADYEQASYCTSCGYHADTANQMIAHMKNFHKDKWAKSLELLKKQGYTENDFDDIGPPDK